MYKPLVLKNTTGSQVFYATNPIPANGQVIASTLDINELTNDVTFLPAIESGALIINNTVADLTIIEAKNYIYGILPTAPLNTLPFPWYYAPFRNISGLSNNNTTNVTHSLFTPVIPDVGTYMFGVSFQYASNSTTQDVIIKLTVPGVGAWNAGQGGDVDIPFRVRTEFKDSAGTPRIVTSPSMGTNQERMASIFDTIPMNAGAQDFRLEFRNSSGTAAIGVWQVSMFVMRVG